MFFILEGMEKLWEPGTAVQSQDPSLLLMKNHLEKNWKGYAWAANSKAAIVTMINTSAIHQATILSTLMRI